MIGGSFSVLGTVVIPKLIQICVVKLLVVNIGTGRGQTIQLGIGCGQAHEASGTGYSQAMAWCDETGHAWSKY